MTTCLLYKNFPVAGLPYKAPAKEEVVLAKTADSQQELEQIDIESEAFTEDAMALFGL